MLSKFKYLVLIVSLLIASVLSQNLLAASSNDTAIFAGGCFWCMQASFDFLKKKGQVISVKVGYTGGTKPNPTYHEINDHHEAIEVIYDRTKISYDKLLDFFWSNVDPMDKEGQFCDKGSQYTSAIYYSSSTQKSSAEKSLKETAKKLKLDSTKVATLIRPAQKFYPAEDYHQDYYLKNPEQYKQYKNGCKRDERLKEVWSR